MHFIKKNIYLYCLSSLIIFSSCNKLIEINPPANSITTTEIFSDSVDAESALAGVYSAMISTGTSARFPNAAITFYAGISADELIPYNAEDNVLSIYSNSLLAQESILSFDVWTPAYKLIYQVNGIIEGVQASSGISVTAKQQMTAEAKFLRAFFYFYLTNLWGDVPYLTTTDYTANAKAARTPQTQIYESMISDLLESQSILPDNYSLNNGDRIRANKWAATALLARVYLYDGRYADAAAQAASIIQRADLFELNPDLNKVFLRTDLDNKEAIFQLLPNTSQPPFDATVEGYTIIPVQDGYPRYYLDNQLLNAFEPGDQRRSAWIDSTDADGTLYYYPYKYKINQVQATANAAPTEYYTVLRLAEQYLIHAEALAQVGNDLDQAINDLNNIRSRAGLPDLSASLTSDEILTAADQEWRIEFFAEWGNRWLNLKRRQQVDAVMTVATPLKNAGTSWQSYQQLYPIPFSERQNDPNLTQNPGY